MPIQFHAPIVRATEEEWGTLIIFSVDEDLAAQRYLLIQRAREVTGDDVRLGMDDVYIETCGQGASWYGHIVSVELLKGTIKVQLDDEAAGQLDDTGLVEVSFDLPAGEFTTLKESLRRAFAGRSYYAEAAA